MHFLRKSYGKIGLHLKHLMKVTLPKKNKIVLTVSFLDSESTENVCKASKLPISNQFYLEIACNKVPPQKH